MLVFLNNFNCNYFRSRGAILSLMCLLRNDKWKCDRRNITGLFFYSILMLSWSQSVNKVVLKIHLPSLLLLFQLADSEVLATTFQTPPSVPANITKMSPSSSAYMLVSLSSCLSIHTSALSLIYYLSPLSFFPLPAFHHRLHSQMYNVSREGDREGGVHF